MIQLLILVGLIITPKVVAATPALLSDDPRRPVDQISRDLGVPADVFRACFSNVHPAAHIKDWRFAAIDLFSLSHVRTFSSLKKSFSNGLLSKEEELLVHLRLAKAMGIAVDEILYARLEQRSSPPQ